MTVHRWQVGAQFVVLPWTAKIYTFQAFFFFLSVFLLCFIKQNWQSNAYIYVFMCAIYDGLADDMMATDEKEHQLTHALPNKCRVMCHDEHLKVTVISLFHERCFHSIRLILYGKLRRRCQSLKHIYIYEMNGIVTCIKSVCMLCQPNHI